MSIADTGASAGTKSWVASCISSRSGMEPGCGKKLHVSKFGVRRLYTRLFERDFFGRLRQCILRFHGWRGTSHTTDLLQGETTTVSHPTRASERGRAKGRPDDTLEQVFKPDNRVSTKQHNSNFDRSLSLATRVSGIYLSCLEPHHHFCDAIQNICCVDADPRPSAVAGSGSKHSYGRDLYH